MTACDGGIASTDLLLDLEAHEGSTMWVRGEVHASIGCTAIACPGADPCNRCFGVYLFGDTSRASNAVVLTPGSGWSYPTFPGTEETPILGCVGDEVVVECTPAVPSRIRAVYGTLRRGSPDWAIEVESLDLADAPREEAAGPTRLVELSL